MEILFYVNKNNRCPVKEFIEKLAAIDRAKILACLKSVEELGFSSPRVTFRQIDNRLWEIKIRTMNMSCRFFYVTIKTNIIMLLHAYKKQSQKAPKKELQIARLRLVEVSNNEENYT